MATNRLRFRDMDAEPLKSVIGDNVKHLREAAGWTQAQLVDQLRRRGLEISRSSIAWLETARREPGTVELLLLAQTFDVPVHELMSTEAPEIQLTNMSVMRTDGLRILITGEMTPLSDAVRVDLPVAELHRSRRWGQQLGVKVDEDLFGEFYFDAEQEPERSVADRLALDPMQVVILAYSLWGTSFSVRRDEDVANKDASPSSMRMLRAHATRRRERELKEKARTVGWLGETPPISEEPGPLRRRSK